MQSIDDESLNTYCFNLEDYLKHDSYDVDGRDLFSELKVLRTILPKGTKEPIEVLKHMQAMEGCFPNAWIAYRILLTIPVTVASIERNFSKLKLIKSYIRSTMSQEMLNELTTLSIERDMAKEIDYTSVIGDFAARNARRAIFK